MLFRVVDLSHPKVLYLHYLLIRNRSSEIIGLAHNLEISVIAEGIETELQLDYLKSLGCDNVQGFLLHKPMDRKALDAFIELSPDSFNF